MESLENTEGKKHNTTDMKTHNKMWDRDTLTNNEKRSEIVQPRGRMVIGEVWKGGVEEITKDGWVAKDLSTSRS
jgi:hypothetical protein